MSADLALLRGALAPTERAAAKQTWAAERPWRAQTHTWLEQDIPVIDLHDLNVKNAKRAASTVIDRAAHLEAPAVLFVVGRGHHSRGRAVLPEVLRGKLEGASRDHGWRWGPARSGRLALVMDPGRAPSLITGRLGPAMWLLIAAIAAALAYACLGLPPE